MNPDELAAEIGMEPGLLTVAAVMKDLSVAMNDLGKTTVPDVPDDDHLDAHLDALIAHFDQPRRLASTPARGRPLAMHLPGLSSPNQHTHVP